MAILTNIGRAAIAASIKKEAIHLAWGTGSSELEENRPELITATKLQNEIGRKIADEVVFCVADEEGELITPTGRFTASEIPTNNLYMRFSFDFEDAANAVIKEVGIMVGTVVKEDIPKGQRYFTLYEIIDPGILLVLEHTVPLIRTPATKESFSFVVTF